MSSTVNPNGGTTTGKVQIYAKDDGVLYVDGDLYVSGRVYTTAVDSIPSAVPTLVPTPPPSSGPTMDPTSPPTATSRKHDWRFTAPGAYENHSTRVSRCACFLVDP